MGPGERTLIFYTRGEVLNDIHMPAMGRGLAVVLALCLILSAPFLAIFMGLWALDSGLRWLLKP